MNIALTGFMGTGKTEVGKLLAQLLKWQFIDVDAEIEKQVGIKISDIFAHKGEPYFRTAETDAQILLCEQFCRNHWTSWSLEFVASLNYGNCPTTNTATLFALVFRYRTMKQAHF